MKARGTGVARSGALLRLRVIAAAAAGAAVLAGCGASGADDAERAAGGPATQATAPTATSPTAASPAAATPSAPAADPAAPGPEGYDPARDAPADIAAAKAAAAKDGRPVLIDFGADWCPDCVVLGRTFTHPSTAALLGRYHVVRVDVGEFDHNLDVAAAYVNLETSGIPALAVLDPGGTLKVATNQGEFSSARSMTASQVDDFLKKWV